MAAMLRRRAGVEPAVAGSVDPVEAPMDVFYEIEAEPRHNLMRVRMAGFFEEEDVRAFATLYREKRQALDAADHLTLANICDMKIQAQDIVAAFRTFMAMPDIASRKLAFVSSSTLARLQAQRLTEREEVRFFDNEAAARDWLLA